MNKGMPIVFYVFLIAVSFVASMIMSILEAIVTILEFCKKAYYKIFNLKDEWYG